MCTPLPNITLNITNANCPEPLSQAYYSIITVIACTLNINLFMLVKNNTHPLMKPFLKILYTSIFIDLTSALFQFATQVRPSIQGPHYILTMCLDGFLPRLLDHFQLFQNGNMNYFLILEYWSCYSIVVYSMVPFVYRYLLTCWNYKMTNIVYALVLFFVLSISLFTAFIITHLSAINHAQNIMLVPKHDPNCFRFLPQMNRQCNIEDPYNEKLYTLWLYLCVSFQWNFLIILIASFLTFYSLRKQSSLMSANQREIQWQLTWTIGGQALFPFLVFFLPNRVASLITENNLFNNALNNLFYQTMFSAYTILPVTNPLVAILFVTSYRRGMAYFLSRIILLFPFTPKFLSSKLKIFLGEASTISVSNS